MQCHTYIPCNQRVQPSTSKSQLCVSKQASSDGSGQHRYTARSPLGEGLQSKQRLGKEDQSSAVLDVLGGGGGREREREGGREEGGVVSKDFPHFSKVHTSPVQFVVVPLHVQFVCVDQQATPPHNTTWRERGSEGGEGTQRKHFRVTKWRLQFTFIA